MLTQREQQTAPPSVGIGIKQARHYTMISSNTKLDVNIVPLLLAGWGLAAKMPGDVNLRKRVRRRHFVRILFLEPIFDARHYSPCRVNTSLFINTVPNRDTVIM